jgi:hypothetical protein
VRHNLERGGIGTQKNRLSAGYVAIVRGKGIGFFERIGKPDITLLSSKPLKKIILKSSLVLQQGPVKVVENFHVIPSIFACVDI